MYFPLEFLDFSPRDVVSKLPLEPSFLAPIPAVSPILLFECSWIHLVCYVRVVGVAGTIHHVADVAALSRSDRGPIIWTLFRSRVREFELEKEFAFWPASVPLLRRWTAK
jgi:hypothetical protein